MAEINQKVSDRNMIVISHTFCEMTNDDKQVVFNITFIIKECEKINYVTWYDIK